MSLKASILIASSNTKDQKMIVERINIQNTEMLTVSMDTTQIEISILKHDPNIVIIDTYNMSYIDTEKLLKNLSLLKTTCLFMVLCHYFDSAEMDKLASIGNIKCMNYSYFDPELSDFLKSHINEMIINKDSIRKQIIKYIYQMLCLYGFHSGMQGFSYLRDAIYKYTVSKNDRINLSKNIYPIIASKYHVTTYSVEWAIRSSINTVWNRSSDNTKKLLLNSEIFDSSSKPSNKSLITAIGDHIRIELKDIISRT